MAENYITPYRWTYSCRKCARDIHYWSSNILGPFYSGCPKHWSNEYPAPPQKFGGGPPVWCEYNDMDDPSKHKSIFEEDLDYWVKGIRKAHGKRL